MPIPTINTDLDKLLASLKVPADLPRYDDLALASEKVPSNTATNPNNADSDQFKDLSPGKILDKLKQAGVDESDPRYLEITTQLEALNCNSSEFEWGDATTTDVEANRALRVQLDVWLGRVEGRLRKLGEVVKMLSAKEEAKEAKGKAKASEEQEDENGEGLGKSSLEIQALVIFTIAAFVSDHSSSSPNRWQRWTSPSTNALAKDILTTLLIPSSKTLPLPLLEALLTDFIKPIFQYNLHPNINPTTGRKLARPAGGPLASQDFYESQRWKEHPGVGNVLIWCLQHFDRECYETIWHLLVPPLMTMLDDYEAKYKLGGVRIVREMMKTVPGSLLKRTGVESLIRSSLTTCLAHLQAEESPALVREAIAAQVELTLLTTRVGEQAYFDQLCNVLGEGIIGGVWFYGYDKESVILASVEALPMVVKALGIGCVRFLNALVGQLTDPLLPKPLRYVPAQLQIASVEALWCIMEEGAPRIDIRKAGVIADAVSRCWVTMVEQRNGGSNSTEAGTVKTMLRQTCERLVAVCPGVVEEYKLMLAGSPELCNLFRELL